MLAIFNGLKGIWGAFDNEAIHLSVFPPPLGKYYA